MTEQAVKIQQHRTADPRALSVAELARLLNAAAEKIREHLAAGAPTAGDGTINLAAELGLPGWREESSYARVAMNRVIASRK